MTARPTLVLRDDALLPKALRQQRLTANEVRQAVRSTGIGDLSEVSAVVLEADGTLSVVARGKAGDLSALQDLNLSSDETSPKGRR